MKLVIQIPCYNEAVTSLETTLRAIPKSLGGISIIETLVIDDGSSDNTSEVAKLNGATHILRLNTHQGLARAFSAGIKECLRLRADVIVNLDADNQYPTRYLQNLVDPILENKADIVLGARDFDAIKEFSFLRRFFQRFGSRVVSVLCRAQIPDAATGFRAFSRSAARKINIFTTYTYTLETLVQASHNKERIVSIPIRTNPPMRPSRLFRHPVAYVFHSAGALVRLTVLYNPLRALGWTAMSLGLTSFGSLALAIYKWGTALGIASAIGAGIGVLLSGIAIFTGLILDQMSVNRRLLERAHQDD